MGPPPPPRSIEFVDETTGRTWLKPIGEVPPTLVSVSGQAVHRVVLTHSGNFPVLRFEGAAGLVLTTVRAPSVS